MARLEDILIQGLHAGQQRVDERTALAFDRGIKTQEQERKDRELALKYPRMTAFEFFRLVGIPETDISPGLQSILLPVDPQLFPNIPKGITETERRPLDLAHREQETASVQAQEDVRRAQAERIRGLLPSEIETEQQRAEAYRALQQGRLAGAGTQNARASQILAQLESDQRVADIELEQANAQLAILEQRAQTELARTGQVSEATANAAALTEYRIDVLQTQAERNATMRELISAQTDVARSVGEARVGLLGAQEDVARGLGEARVDTEEARRQSIIDKTTAAVAYTGVQSESRQRITDAAVAKTDAAIRLLNLQGDQVEVMTPILANYNAERLATQEQLTARATNQAERVAAQTELDERLGVIEEQYKEQVLLTAQEQTRLVQARQDLTTEQKRRISEEINNDWDKTLAWIITENARAGVQAATQAYHQAQTGLVEFREEVLRQQLPLQIQALNMKADAEAIQVALIEERLRRAEALTKQEREQLEQDRDAHKLNIQKLEADILAAAERAQLYREQGGLVQARTSTEETRNQIQQGLLGPTMARAQAQADQAAADLRRSEAQALKAETQASLERALAPLRLTNAEMDNERVSAAVDLIGERIEGVRASTNLTDERALTEAALRDPQVQKAMEDLEQAREDARRASSQADKAVTEARVAEETESDVIRRIRADANKSEADVDRAMAAATQAEVQARVEGITEQVEINRRRAVAAKAVADAEVAEETAEARITQANFSARMEEARAQREELKLESERLAAMGQPMSVADVMRSSGAPEELITASAESTPAPDSMLTAMVNALFKADEEFTPQELNALASAMETLYGQPQVDPSDAYLAITLAEKLGPEKAMLIPQRQAIIQLIPENIRRLLEPKLNSMVERAFGTAAPQSGTGVAVPSEPTGETSDAGETSLSWPEDLTISQESWKVPLLQTVEDLGGAGIAHARLRAANDAQMRDFAGFFGLQNPTTEQIEQFREQVGAILLALIGRGY